ncbi:MAG: UDP-N-acetylglucosamine 1-carboxyvinyltransferase [Candidatus Dojkabacteria bacterium]
MSSLVIEGGHKLKGTVTALPNKNSILKIIPAAVLADGPVTIHNVPKSTSVRVLLQIFKQLGGKVAYLKDNSIRLDGTTINTSAVDEELAMKERSSFLFLGPLVYKFGKSSIRDGGGCKLGNRPLDTLFQGLEGLGVKVDSGDGYKISADELKGSKIWLLEASVTGTENLVLAAVKAKGTTVIYNAACEPHTQDLCNFLVSIGAQIEGIGTNQLTIIGVESLTGGEWTIISDHIDIGGLMVTALVTDGEITIKNAIPQHMTQVINYFRKLNAKIKIQGDDIFIPSGQKLECKVNMKGDMDKINDLPWPGFPVDLIPQALVLALKAKGSIRVYSTLYEVQLIELYAELFKMNAKMTMGNPNMIITYGPAEFIGTKVNASTIIQCTHALVLAALAAKGKTTIDNADIIYRRFPEIVQTLSALGAKISKA